MLHPSFLSDYFGNPVQLGHPVGLGCDDPTGRGCSSRSRGGQRSVEDERASRVDEMVAQQGGSQHGATLCAESLRQGGGYDNMSGIRETRGMYSSSSGAGHTDAVRFVNHQQGVVGRTQGGGAAQIRGVAQHRIDRLDDDHCPPLASIAQEWFKRIQVAVWADRHG
jgi:hypothetical protein